MGTNGCSRQTASSSLARAWIQEFQSNRSSRCSVRLFNMSIKLLSDQRDGACGRLTLTKDLYEIPCLSNQIWWMFVFLPSNMHETRFLPILHHDHLRLIASGPPIPFPKYFSVKNPTSLYKEYLRSITALLLLWNMNSTNGCRVTGIPHPGSCRPPLRALFYTAHASDNIRDYALNNLAVNTLTKPCSNTINWTIIIYWIT